MSRALDKSPFTRHIEGTMLPRRFQQPTFTIYNGNTNPVEHVSQFNQKMAVHSKNKALMCKVFPSSLGPVAMRWFNGLNANSVDSYMKLTQAFGSRFVTNSRAPQPLSALLSLSMRDGETLKTYLGKYWEMYKEMDSNFDDVTINTFKNSLPTEHGLKKSLIGKPATSVHQLIDRIDKYKRVEEDQLQGKGKEKVIPQERRDFRSNQYNNNLPRRHFARQSETTNAQTVSAVFREPMHQMLEKIKNEPYFRWPNKMAGESTKRNQIFYHGELQEPLELSGPAGPRRKVEAPSASFQWSSRPDSPGTPKKCYPKATRRDDQYYPGRTRKNRHMPLTSIIHGSAAY